VKILFVLAPVILALSSCAGVTVVVSIGYQGVSASVTISKDPVKPTEPPVVIEPDGKAPVPVDPVDETQPQT
jgi:hypothetical protein